MSKGNGIDKLRKELLLIGNKKNMPNSDDAFECFARGLNMIKDASKSHSMFNLNKQKDYLSVIKLNNELINEKTKNLSR